MKRFFLAIVMVTFLGGITVAQEEADVQDAAKAVSGASIEFDSEVHNFGKIPYKGDGDHDFVFTNTGSEPLIISNAKGSCGCTVPVWPKEPVMPGEKASINVKYDTKRVGAFTKTVTITSNAVKPTQVLTIKGVVRSMEETENLTPVKLDEEGAAPIEKSETN